LGRSISLRLMLWTYGESNPDLFHAMEPFYRYTIGPYNNERIAFILDFFEYKQTMAFS
jgi:hypothetical protein